MPAPLQSSLKGHTLGVIAGAGNLPGKLLNACDRRGQEVFVVAIDGQTNPSITKGRNHMIARMGAAGKIIKTLKSHDVRDLVMIGSVRRPTLAELRPDFRALKFFMRLGFRAKGDNNLLSALRRELEEEGFSLHGIQSFVDDLLAAEGALGRYKPSRGDWDDINRGIEVATALGKLDVGQSVIVQEGIVLGVEGAEGTDELIRRCRLYKRKGRGGVLVKIAKPQQDRDLDLPTIGPQTVRLCSDALLSGIVVQAGNSLVIDPQDVADIANREKMFVLGIDLSKDKNECDHPRDARKEN